MLRAKNETNPEFLYYFAISPDFRKRAIECMEGTSGRQRVNENALKTLELPIPEPQIQQSIAAVLSALDKKSP
nr:restriction endonuclease subunit S [Neisseria gonorrhoeae]